MWDWDKERVDGRRGGKGKAVTLRYSVLGGGEGVKGFWAD